MQELEKILYELEKRIFTAEVYNDDFDGTTITNLICLGDVRDILEKHMNDGWIPVEERLPIPNKEIWVTVKRNGNVFTSTDGMTEKGHFWNYEKENILAWKEKELIPEPYCPERSEGE